MSVCFPHGISETYVARITTLDTEMFHRQSWKSVIFFRRSKVKITSRKNIAGVGLCTLVSAGFFWFDLSSLLGLLTAEAGFPIKKLWIKLKRDFYRPDVLAVTQQTA